MGGFATYYGEENLHPLGLIAIIVLSVAVMVTSRRRALAPLFIAATTIPMAQRLIFFGADFTLLRILLLVYLVRVIFRREYTALHWNRLDGLVICWAVAGSIVMTLHYGTAEALVNRLGWSYDILITYFISRCILRSLDDLSSIARTVALVSVPVSLLFILEWQTGRNLFSVFGGVPAETVVRAGKLRCQGAFAHPILAGTYWVSCLPLLWTLWKDSPRDRGLCVTGTVAAITIVLACASSTPIVTSVVAILGVGLFILRRFRTHLWMGMLIVLALLHFVIMQAPVWHLISRVGVVGGSTGWHRYIIFDTFIKNFDNWYLSGESDTTSWGVWHMRDITNQYILEGVNGGLLTLALFVLMLVIAFGNVGQLLKTSRRSSRNVGVSFDWKVWLLGVAMLVHVASFFGVSYFGQMVTIFYVQLAIIASITAGARIRGKVKLDIKSRPERATRPSSQIALHSRT